MTIAEKLTQIAENEQKVFDAGYAKGTAQGGYAEGYADGKQAEYDAFWDAFQNYGNKRYYYYAFAWQQTDNEAWATDAYNPKYPIIADCNAGEPSPYATQSIFHYSSRLKDVKVPITLKNGAANACFYNCYRLTNIPSLTLENVTGFVNTFMNCNALETLIVHGKIEADIDLQWSTKLSMESIESIMCALSDTTTGKSITLSKVAVDKAYETSEGANDGSTSAEWIAIRNTKKNWTVSLI
jgi:hypothetical protein